MRQLLVFLIIAILLAAGCIHNTVEKPLDPNDDEDGDGKVMNREEIENAKARLLEPFNHIKRMRGAKKNTGTLTF